ncbi:MAG: ABC-2 family transporter protein [candidate division FCPU426 bacterium]
MLKGYLAFFSSALQAHLAYSGSLLISLAASAVGYLITVMIWNYALPDRAEAHAMFAYLTLGFVMTYITSLFLERSIGERIREGLVATDLLKPVDFQLFYMVQSLSDLVFQAVLSLLIMGLGALILGRDLMPASPAALPAFFLSVGLAFLVQYGISFAFVQGIFLTNSNYGIFASRQALHQTFSGVFAPLAMYPPALRAVAEWLPFQHVVYTPVGIYLGRIQGAAVGRALLEQALWAVALLLGSRLLFKKMLTKITIQGG